MKNFSCLPGAAGFNFTNFFDSARLDGQRAIRCQDAPNNQNLLNQSTEENVFYSATVSSRKNYRGKKKFLCQTAKNFQFTKTVSGRKKFEKLNIGWETKKIGAISFNLFIYRLFVLVMFQFGMLCRQIESAFWS